MDELHECTIDINADGVFFTNGGKRKQHVVLADGSSGPDVEYVHPDVNGLCRVAWFNQGGAPPDETAPNAILKSGVCVANFNSSHMYVFDDGTLLPRCGRDRALRIRVETDTKDVEHHDWTDRVIAWTITPAILNELRRLEDDQDIDIVILERVLFRLLLSEGHKFSKIRMVQVKGNKPLRFNSKLFLAA